MFIQKILNILYNLTYIHILFSLQYIILQKIPVYL